MPSRRDILELEEKIERLKEELTELKWTPFKVGYATLIKTLEQEIKYNENMLLEWEKEHARERYGK